MQIEFNKDEATALKQLLDLATKAQGLSVAEAASHLFKKIVEAENNQMIETTEVCRDECIEACGECNACEDCEPCEEANGFNNDYSPHNNDSRSARRRRAVQRHGEV